MSERLDRGFRGDDLVPLQVVAEEERREERTGRADRDREEAAAEPRRHEGPARHLQPLRLEAIPCEEREHEEPDRRLEPGQAGAPVELDSDPRPPEHPRRVHPEDRPVHPAEQP